MSHPGPKKLIIRASFGTAWDIPKSIYKHDHDPDLFATTASDCFFYFIF